MMIKVGSNIDVKLRDGPGIYREAKETVIYIHPEQRFYTVQFTGLYSEAWQRPSTFRESFFMGDRAGQGLAVGIKSE